MRLGMAVTHRASVRSTLNPRALVLLISLFIWLHPETAPGACKEHQHPGTPGLCSNLGFKAEEERLKFCFFDFQTNANDTASCQPLVKNM